MPTKRSLRKRPTKPVVSEAALAAMFDQEPPPGANRFEVLDLCRPGGKQHWADLWDEFGASVVQEWVKDNPGRRPNWWWIFSAPEPRPDNETETEFLRRHQLFLDDEEQRIDAANMEGSHE